MSDEMNRRGFVKSTILGASAATAAGMSVLSDNVHGSDQYPPLVKKREIPTGTIGDVTFSRMMLGGNLIGHYNHVRDLNYIINLATHYNTPEKIYETMRLAEEHGINTINLHVTKPMLDALKEYRKRGGTLQTLLYSVAPVNEDLVEFTQTCQEAIDAGADAIYLWGERSDRMIGPQPELFKRAINTMRSFGVPVGVAAHKLEVVEFCEQEKIPLDFYVKTFHHHNYPSATLNFDSSWCDDPERHIEVMAKVEKPWIAYKVMAAGAIPPKNALDYAFSNGADFVIFGMFDFEIDEDTRLLNEVLAQENVKNRPRKWFA